MELRRLLAIWDVMVQSARSEYNTSAENYATLVVNQHDYGSLDIYLLDIHLYIHRAQNARLRHALIMTTTTTKIRRLPRELYALLSV